MNNIERQLKGHTMDRKGLLVIVTILGLLLAALLMANSTAPSLHQARAEAPLLNDSAPDPSDPIQHLQGSSKKASQNTLLYNEVLSYTIALVNSGNTKVTVDVIDPISPLLKYYEGSATSNGSYSSNKKTLTWNNVEVPAGGKVSLTFMVTSAWNVKIPTPVINTAFITTDTAQNASEPELTADSSNILARSAVVILLPQRITGANLSGSFKVADRATLAFGEVISYTIKLINSGTADAELTVTDPVPGELQYMPDSATGSGVYHTGTKTLTWSNIAVPKGGWVTLSFAAKPAAKVSNPKVVKNEATIAWEDQTIERQALVMLMPDPVQVDSKRPVIDSVVIGNQDVLTGRDVDLHISAHDNVGVTHMYIREWRVVTSPWPYWEEVKSSGWVPYQTTYPWKLGDSSGVHYVGVWAIDAAQNQSHMDTKAMDFASLVLPGTQLGAKDVMPYMVYYEAGINVNIKLTPTSGDADLYVWFPRQFGRPNLKSLGLHTTQDEISFVTPSAGTYVILVHAFSDTTYDLAITPGGGGSIATAAITAFGEAAGADANGPSEEKEELAEEPVFSKSGTDPLALGEGSEPAGLYRTYIPFLKR